MKKKKVMGLLGLMSCAALITSCSLPAPLQTAVDWANKNIISPIADLFNGGSKKEEKKDEDKPTPTPAPEPEKSISLKELPEQVFVGDTLDLDSYVELQNVSSYTVELASASSELASLEGHVLRFIEEGDVAFTVSAAGKSASGSVSSIRESRLALMEYFEGVGNQYTVLAYHEYQTAGEDTKEDSSDDEYEWQMDDVIFHDTNYILSLGSWDSDEETGEAIPGGFLRFSEESENAYKFSILETEPASEEEEGEEYVELGKKLSSLYLDAYNPEFGVDFAEAKYELDTESGADLYVIEGNDAKWFAEESLFIPNGTPYTGYPVTRVEFNIYDEAEEGEEPSLAVDAYVYITYNGAPYHVEIATLYTDEEAVGYPLLQEYCVPENEPQGEDYWNYFGEQIGLGDFFLSPTSPVGPNGLINIEYGWVDDEGESIDLPAGWAGTDFEYLPVGGKTMLLSANSIWEVDPVVDEESGEITDFSPLSGKMAVTSEDEEPVTVVYNIVSAETESGFFAEEADEGVWEGSEVFAGLADRSNYPRGAINEVEDLYVEIPGETEEDPTQQVYDGTVFHFDQGKANGFVESLIAGDDGLYMLDVLLSYYGEGISKYFAADLTINPNYGTVELTIAIPFGEDENWQIKFESSYNPSVAQLASSYEAYMLANVINVGE